MKETKVKRDLREQKAITLIALVITIIVLLILAAVSIATLTGQNGILTQADNAKEKNIVAQEKEAISLAYTGCKTNDFLSNVTDLKLQKELEKIRENGQVNTLGEDLLVTFTDTNHKYKIKQNGEIEKIADLTPEEKNKIVYIEKMYGTSSEKYIILTAGGIVKIVDKTLNFSSITELDVSNAKTVTTDGIRQLGSGNFIDNKGKVYTWGDNSYGQLGNGKTDSSDEPICISDIKGNILNGKNIINMVEHNSDIIALDSEGKVYTWGNNSDGLLGDGTNVSHRNYPVCISDIDGMPLKERSIVNIYRSGQFAIALDDAGKVYTWGKNYEGELGNGTNAHSNKPICISDMEDNALKGKKIEKIANFYPVIVLDSEGRIYTWGRNLYGRLGNGTDENSNKPICISEIEGSQLKGCNIIEIKSGNAIIALDSEGRVYTWGYNYEGELGNGTNAHSNKPICISNIEGNVLKEKRIEKIVNVSPMIVLDSEGKVYTWGNNEYGLLGAKTTESYSNKPICISEIEGSILNGKNIVKVNNTNHKTIIALDKEGKIYTWGSNSDGQLGDGTKVDYRNYPVCISDINEIPLKGNTIVNIINSEGSFAKVIDEQGNVYLWGSNKYGQMGIDLSEEYIDIPICINDIKLNNKKVKEIFEEEEMVFYLTEDGKIFYNKWENTSEPG